jgi:hypothetical protein
MTREAKEIYVISPKFKNPEVYVEPPQARRHPKGPNF